MLHYQKLSIFVLLDQHKNIEKSDKLVSASIKMNSKLIITSKKSHMAFRFVSFINILISQLKMFMLMLCDRMSRDT